MLVATDDLPTPPLPDATATMCWMPWIFLAAGGGGIGRLGAGECGDGGLGMREVG